MKKIMTKFLWFATFALFLILILPMFFYIQTKRYIYPDVASLKDIRVTETAVIPGAAILRDNSLSPVLKDRVDRAIELYNSHKVIKMLVTGNNSEVNYDEVGPVRKYLLNKDIPSEDIFLDHAGFDTYSGIYRARSVFDVQSMVIVSQSFHLPRAVFIARSLGIDAYGLSADNGHYSFYNYLREIPADIKALFNILFDRIPKYLGPIIPINGDGNKTI
ncbi:MAG: ElyC/SanA/YdcF family protein [Candidatus Paceibacterota bacterium]